MFLQSESLISDVLLENLKKSNGPSFLLMPTTICIPRK